MIIIITMEGSKIVFESKRIMFNYNKKIINVNNSQGNGLLKIEYSSELESHLINQIKLGIPLEFNVKSASVISKICKFTEINLVGEIVLE